MFILENEASSRGEGHTVLPKTHSTGKLPNNKIHTHTHTRTHRNPPAHIWQSSGNPCSCELQTASLHLVVDPPLPQSHADLLLLLLLLLCVKYSHTHKHTYMYKYINTHMYMYKTPFPDGKRVSFKRTNQKNLNSGTKTTCPHDECRYTHINTCSRYTDSIHQQYGEIVLLAA